MPATTSATTTRTPRATAKKKATEYPATEVELLPPEGPVEPCSLDEAIIDQVMAQVDRSEFIGALAEKVALHLAGTIKLDELAARLLEQRLERLSAQLVERLLDRLGG